MYNFLSPKQRLMFWLSSLLPKSLKYYILIGVLDEMRPQGHAFEAKMIDIAEEYRQKHRINRKMFFLRDILKEHESDHQKRA